MTHRRNQPWSAPDVQLDRITTPYFSRDESDPDDQVDTFYAHMFVEDISQGLFPFSNSYGGKEFEIRLEPSSESLEDMVAAALSFAHHGQHGDDLADAVSEWGRFCAAAMLGSGRAVYELAYRISRDRMPVGFALIPLESRYVVRRFGGWEQRLPSRASSEGSASAGDRPVASRAFLSADRIVIVDFPHEYKKLRRIVPLLRILSRDRYPSFMLPRPDVPPPARVPFNFDLFRRTEEVAIASATESVGWYGRGTFGDRLTEYYATVRALRLERVKCHLRSHILGALDAVLSQAGSRLRFSACLKVSGLPSLDDVAAAEARLAIGDLPVDQVLAPFRNY